MTTKIGEFIKEKRNDLGVTKEQIGEAMGITASTVGQIETGSIKKPPRHRLEGLSYYLGLDLDKILGMIGQKADGINNYEEQLRKENIGGQSKRGVKPKDYLKHIKKPSRVFIEILLLREIISSELEILVEGLTEKEVYQGLKNGCFTWGYGEEYPNCILKNGKPVAKIHHNAEEYLKENTRDVLISKYLGSITENYINEFAENLAESLTRLGSHAEDYLEDRE